MCQYTLLTKNEFNDRLRGSTEIDCDYTTTPNSLSKNSLWTVKSFAFTGSDTTMCCWALKSEYACLPWVIIHVSLLSQLLWKMTYTLWHQVVATTSSLEILQCDTHCQRWIPALHMVTVVWSLLMQSVLPYCLTWEETDTWTVHGINATNATYVDAVNITWAH